MLNLNLFQIFISIHSFPDKSVFQYRHKLQLVLCLISHLHCRCPTVYNYHRLAFTVVYNPYHRLFVHLLSHHRKIPLRIIQLTNRHILQPSYDIIRRLQLNAKLLPSLICAYNLHHPINHFRMICNPFFKVNQPQFIFQLFHNKHF